MPSIGHLLLGATLGLALYYISDKKFTKYHVFILFMNNYLGPDVGWVVDGGILSHNVFGFCIIALPLAAIYSYFTRFSPDFRRKELTDLGKVRLPYLNTYCLVVAGGTLHNYLDGIINGGGHFSLAPSLGTIPGWSPTIADFQGLWNDGVLNIGFLAILIGIPFIMGFIYYFTYFLKHTPRKAVLGITIYIAAFMLVFYLFGMPTTGHNEAGAIAFVTLFWVFPLSMITLSVKIPVKVATPDKRPQENSNIPLVEEGELTPTAQQENMGVSLGKIVVIFFFLVGALLLLAGIGCLVLPNYIVQWVVDHFPLWIPYTTNLANFLMAGGITLVIGGGIAILAGYKLKVGEPTDFRFVLYEAWLFIAGFLPILVAVGASTIAAPAAEYVFIEYGTTIGPYITEPQLVMAIQYAAIVFLALGIFDYLCAVGILRKSERWRRITFLVNICWAWAILGLVFAGYLSQTDVRAKFQQARNPEAV